MRLWRRLSALHRERISIHHALISCFMTTKTVDRVYRYRSIFELCEIVVGNNTDDSGQQADRDAREPACWCRKA